MNRGKICVSLCAKTVAELTEKIKAATGKADLIELRFDCLDKDELRAEDAATLNETLSKIFPANLRAPWITTFRPAAGGGSREISELERQNFWSADLQTEISDLEEDMFDGFRPRNTRICSYHDFSGVPDDLRSLFNRLADTGAEIVKVAATVNDAVEAISIWKLLEIAVHEGKQVVPIAMGEAGKWTRILGLGHGAPIAYASLDDSGGTAPGQIAVRDMRDVFRVKELDLNTEVFGVIAGNTSYSLSPYMHNAAFRTSQTNAVFIPLQVSDLDSFVRRMTRAVTREVELNFRGFSVTNPHKQTIIRHLDFIDETAKKIGAVNTVKVDGDHLTGYNTDAPGFIQPLKNVLGDLKGSRVAIVGGGGAARACVYALLQEGAEVAVLVRDPASASSLAEEFGIEVVQLTTDNRRLTSFDILVNATPLGTRGEHESDTIATADEIRGIKLVYDLVYNPSETRLLREASAAGAKTLGGLDMLVAQGAKQFEIWTGQTPPVDQMRNAVEERLK